LPEAPEDLDLAARLAAFAYLDRHLQENQEETLSWMALKQGFEFRGRRVQLVGPQGIFKPSILELPLTIRSKAPELNNPFPYDDAITSDGILHYAFRTGDHPDNRRLERAAERRVPLVYLRGIVPGRYLPFFPVYIAGVDLSRRTFLVPLEDASFWTEQGGVGIQQTAQPQRSYVTVPVKKRLHQTNFRERVLGAYRECCAICRLRHRELLDATHILPDKHPLGEPVVSNGLSLCKLHHAAYDRHVLGIRPDCRIDVRLDILEEVDGPMLLHGLQGFQGQQLLPPRRARDQPNRDYLAERYEQFLRAS
jgi:putative restriction endonuclease